MRKKILALIGIIVIITIVNTVNLFSNDKVYSLFLIFNQNVLDLNDEGLKGIEIYPDFNEKEKENYDFCWTITGGNISDGEKMGTEEIVNKGEKVIWSPTVNAKAVCTDPVVEISLFVIDKEMDKKVAKETIFIKYNNGKYSVCEE